MLVVTRLVWLRLLWPWIDYREAIIELIKLVSGEPNIAKRTMLLLAGPLFDAFGVEVVSFVARQRRHHVSVREVSKTNDALCVLVESLGILDARHAFQGNAHAFRGNAHGVVHFEFRRIFNYVDVDPVRWKAQFITVNVRVKNTPKAWIAASIVIIRSDWIIVL